MRSVMEHSFSEVPRADIPRSSFDRSHGVKTTFDADYLIPILVDDIVPGDTFNVNCNFFGRLASPLDWPIMDNMFVETFFFFVPYRLVWTNWEKMHGAQDDPSDSIDFTVPGRAATFSANDLGDYMGLPPGVSLTGINDLPFRAYNLIWNEWFRDQNLQDSATVDTGDSTTTFANYPLRKRGKRHDYFTSCLPSPQKGDAVELPLADLGTIDVEPSGTYVGPTWRMLTSPYSVLNYMALPGGSSSDVQTNNFGSGAATNIGWSDPNLRVNFGTTSSAVTINALRLAFQTQRLLERDARSGTRYNEMILAHFGVTVPDFRVQRPEFLGGGSSPFNVTPVAQTTYQGTPTASDAQGSLSAFGTVSGRHGFTKSFVEHGVLIGLMNLRGDITYSQGVERYWHKDTRYDFYYPVLAQIGEQSVLNQEIFAQGTGDDTNVFGYQERYAEYRYKPSQLTSKFRVDATGSLSAWHLSEDFASLPTLGDSFIQSNTGTPLDRAVAVGTEPHVIMDIHFDMQCARPMPVYGVPGNLDHF